MNLSPRWTGVLTGAGMQAEHWSTVGRVNATDPEIMPYAAENGFIILTHDLDFSAILAATGGAKPSVVQIRTEDVDPNLIGKRVIAALQQMAVELEAGALLTIDPGRARLRVLPLQSS